MADKKHPLKNYADKAPTDLQKRFAEWIESQTGVKPDLQTVALAVNLRMPFQRSDENQVFVKASRERAAATRDARSARAAGKAPVAKSEEPAAPKRRRPAKPKAAEPVPEEQVTGSAGAVVEPDSEPPVERPEPQFEDPKADAAVETAQKAAPKALRAPRARRSAKDPNKDLVD